MKVKVFSTQMGEREIETSATTWEGLQGDLKKEGISYNKMKAVIGENKLTLEAGGAMLPAQGFTLFLMNKKTKAGMGKKQFVTYKYGELRGTIRFILDQDPSQADYFNDEKNYTTKGTEVLRDLLGKYKGSVPSLDNAMAFVAEQKGKKKSKAKPKAKAKPESKPKTKTSIRAKGVTVGKNEIEEPKRGFGAEDSAPKKKNSIIEKAQKAIEEVAKEEPKTVGDVVESVKESKTEEVKCSSIETLNSAVLTIVNLDISEFGEDAQDLLNMSLDTIKGGVKDFKDNFIYLTEKIAKRKAEAKIKEEEAKAKALAEQKAEEEEARLEKEAQDRIDAEHEKIRVAKEKVDEEERATKEKADDAMREMRDMFSDVN